MFTLNNDSKKFLKITNPTFIKAEGNIFITV